MLDDRTWLFLGAGVYAATLAATLFALYAERRLPSRPLIMGMLAVGFALQTIGLQIRGLSIGGCPIGNPFEVLQFISWSTIAVYFLAGSVFRLSLLGGFCASVATLLSVVSFAVPGGDRPYAGPLFGDSAWVEAHAALALFSYGVFGLLAATAAMYLLQDYGLKHKRFTALFRLLPSIVQLDAVHHRLLTVGAGVFTLSILLGSVHWIGDWENVTPGKLFTTLLVWFGYVLASTLRWRKWLRGPRLAWVLLGLFGAALLTLWPIEASREPTAAAFLLALLPR
ncbi:MAG: inner membrane protein YpjD [Opitutales bacterium]